MRAPDERVEEAMDERNAAGNPGEQARVTESGLWVQLLRLCVPCASALPRLGRWTLRALRWQRPVRQVVSETRMTWRRIHPAFKFIYYVLPARTLRPHLGGRPLARPVVAARARIITNPTSGGLHGELGLQALEETAAWLSERGLPTELCLTECAGHARGLAREAVVAGMEMVIAAGGDGTINEIVQ